MKSTTKPRSVLARTVIATTAAGALVATLGTAGWATLSSNAGYPKGNLTKAQIALAAKYTGGKANTKASGTAVTIGFINDDNGVVPYPENWQGAQLAQWFVNTYLGGIKGHPLAFDHCSANDDTSTAACATQMVNDGVKLVLTGTILNNDSADVPDAATAHIPVIVGNGLTTADFGPPGGGTAVTYMPGSPGVVQGLAKFIGKGGPAPSRSPSPWSTTGRHRGADGVQLAVQAQQVPHGRHDRRRVDRPNAPALPGGVRGHRLWREERQRVRAARPGPGVHLDLRRDADAEDHEDQGRHDGAVLRQAAHQAPPRDIPRTAGTSVTTASTTSSTSPRSPPSAQLAVYIAAVHQHAPTIDYTGFAGPSFGNVLTAVEVVQPRGPAATSARSRRWSRTSRVRSGASRAR